MIEWIVGWVDGCIYRIYKEFVLYLAMNRTAKI